LKFENHANYNVVIELDTGEKYLIYANWMHNQNIDNFKDWFCEAGITRLTIDDTGNVFSGDCKNALLGNLNTTWNLLDETDAICKRDRCTGCTDDLIVKKENKKI